MNSEDFLTGQLFPKIVNFMKLGARAALQQLKDLGHVSPDVSGRVIDLQKALAESPPDLLGKFD